MRCGIEKTNETTQSLIQHEEEWLNRELPRPGTEYQNMSFDELRVLPTVLSTRNDLVLPRYYESPNLPEKEGRVIDLIKGFVMGLFLSLFVLLLITDEGNWFTKRHNLGVYLGSVCNFGIIFGALWWTMT